MGVKERHERDREAVARAILDAARELLESVLASMCREFGEQHLDSLVAMGNLAAVLWQQGDRDEAYALQQHVVGLQRRVRGDGDRATRAAAENKGTRDKSYSRDPAAPTSKTGIL